MLLLLLSCHSNSVPQGCMLLAADLAERDVHNAKAYFTKSEMDYKQHLCMGFGQRQAEPVS